MPRFIKCNSVDESGNLLRRMVFDANKIVAVVEVEVDSRSLTSVTLLGESRGAYWIDLSFDVVTDLLTPEEAPQ